MTDFNRAMLITSMKFKGIRAKELADTFGISQVYVSDILNGKKTGTKAIEWLKQFKDYVEKVKEHV